MKHNFRKLKIWKEAVDITIDVYKLTKKLPKEEIQNIFQKANQK